MLDAALRDADAIAEGGMHGLVVENFGSWPFAKGTPEDPAPTVQIAFIARAVAAIRSRVDLPVGVNVLRNDAHAALSVAAACGGAFIRVNVHAGAALTDQGIIEGRAAHTLRLRQQLGAESVALFADVRVKHAAPLVPRDLVDEVEELTHRAGADAVIVTGRGTGQPVDHALLAEVATAAAGRPVYIGSGMRPTQAALMQHAHGAIVGTWIKRGGDVRAPADVARVRELVAAVG